MRKPQLVLFLLLFLSGSVFGQKITVKGVVTDTLEKKKLELASVTLVKSADSVMVAYDRTGKDGSFQFKDINPGAYILYVSFPKYAGYTQELSLDKAQPLVDLSELPIIPVSKLLEEVVVRQNRAIRMRGDTIEYTADSFKVRDGASVKELLRVMPGLQVDNKGQVTAQGQKVEKVLVDGEEFFSDDPAVVIENLRADAIDKVQSFDKKSEQAEFTGVDDGSRSKTLNLVLKEDRKKGYFGKVVIGGGTSERYSEEAMINFFKGKKKLSVYGIASNTGVTGLGWQDRNKFGEEEDFGDGNVEMGAGFIMITGGADNDFSDWENRYYDEGIPSTIKAGAHFSDKWNKDKHHTNANYTFRNMRVEGTGSSLTKFILPDSAYYSSENHRNNSRQTRQLASGLYDWKVDSLASLRLRLNAKKEERFSENNSFSEINDEDFRVVNDNERRTSTDQESEAYMASLLWRQKFSKNRRTLSLSVSHKYNETNSDGYLYSILNQYAPDGTINNSTVTDQFKTNFSKTLTTNSRLVYTEPTGKRTLVEFNYAFSRVSSLSDRKSFDADNNGKYTAFNDVFSNRYGLNYLSNSAGLKYQYNGKKLTANIGTNLGVSEYRQTDSAGDLVQQRRYTNLFPNSRISYKFAAQRSLNFTYTGTPQPPSINQIQPIQENTNPQFIIEGNPDLDQAFRHNFSVFFNDFKTLTGRSIWMNGSFSTTQNAIVPDQTTIGGITKQRYINSKGVYNYWFYLSYGFKIAKPDIRIGVNYNSNGGRYITFINSIRNLSKNQTHGLSLSVSKYKEDKYDFYINSEFSYNLSSSTISSLKSNFLSQEHNINGNYMITKKFRVGTDVNIYLREKTDAFDSNNNFTVWNASMAYKFLKKDAGELRFQVYDILKQRKGFDRSFGSDRIYERRYNMLGQYAMLSFTWNFNKSPGQK